MQNLKSIPDHALLSQIKNLAFEERRLGVEILYRLREIEVRQLFAKEGYGSLHEFAVKALHYSDGAAHRRIQAMRLLKDMPDAEILDAMADLALKALDPALKQGRSANADRSTERRKIHQCPLQPTDCPTARTA